MKIGDKEFYLCNNCPAYKWNGENTSSGDQGHRCEFGLFTHYKGEDEKPIPEDCPLSLKQRRRDTAMEVLKEYRVKIDTDIDSLPLDEVLTKLGFPKELE